MASGTYLDDLVDFVVVLLVGAGVLISCYSYSSSYSSSRHHLAFRFLGTSVAVRGCGRVCSHVLAAMPLVVGASGIGLKIAGRRGCAWRGARVWMHGGGLLQVQVRRAGDRQG